MARPTDRARLRAIFTGGTISCVVDATNGLPVPTLRGENLLERTPGMADIADIAVDNFGRYPGPHMDPLRILELAERIRDATDDRDVDGVIVTHGTDSLEETAFLLDRVLTAATPVVVTGAMNLASDPQGDGPANLLAAARIAASSDAHGRGVLVAIAGQIHAAAEVVKVDAEAPDAFASPRSGPVGSVADEEVIFFSPAAPSPLASFDGRRIETNVDLIRNVAGDDGRYVRASIAAGARGIVVEGMGRGNVTPGLAAAIKDAAHDLPIIMTTRCARGGAAPIYGYDGGGATLQEAGVIFAGRLPGAKARLLLMLLLGSGAAHDDICTAFEAVA